MSLPDDFYNYVAPLLDGRYDCVDRIVLNGYFLMGQTSGGLLTWWNQLCPGAPLDQKRLEQMAGDFSRRLHAFAKARHIPVIYFTKASGKKCSPRCANFCVLCSQPIRLPVLPVKVRQW